MCWLHIAGKVICSLRSRLWQNSILQPRFGEVRKLCDAIYGRRSTLNHESIILHSPKYSSSIGS